MITNYTPLPSNRQYLFSWRALIIKNISTLTAENLMHSLKDTINIITSHWALFIVSASSRNTIA